MGQVDVHCLNGVPSYTVIRGPINMVEVRKFLKASRRVKADVAKTATPSPAGKTPAAPISGISEPNWGLTGKLFAACAATALLCITACVVF